MTVSRTTTFLIGTSETSGVTIANNANSSVTSQDVLGNNTSEGCCNVHISK